MQKIPGGHLREARFEGMAFDSDSPRFYPRCMFFPSSVRSSMCCRSAPACG